MSDPQSASAIDLTTPPTAEQVQSEPAGRRLDAWVSLWALGREPYYWDVRPDDYKPGVLCERLVSEGPIAKRLLPPYSTLLPAAWEVVDWMADHDCGVVLEDWRADKTAPAAWSVYFVLLGGHTSEGALGKTAQEAVCKAALLARLTQHDREIV